MNNVKRYAELGHRLPALEAEEGEQEEERPAKQKNQDKNVRFLKKKQTL